MVARTRVSSGRSVFRQSGSKCCWSGRSLVSPRRCARAARAARAVRVIDRSWLNEPSADVKHYTDRGQRTEARDPLIVTPSEHTGTRVQMDQH
ncbi:unnamed protein product [Danaus chrysippus]|uniref:(African queen) hypothetical protein n=1 Tax=Danaus chrysippus TaxID=151541 RepID=A0A8J2W0L5_9NEOP|nr:unnamed protein product [Danaus chrysippus]